MRPSNPSSRSASAAFAPARLAPTITNVRSSATGAPFQVGPVVRFPDDSRSKRCSGPSRSVPAHRGRRRSRARFAPPKEGCFMPLDPNIEALLNEGEEEGPSFSLGVEESRAAEYEFIELCGPEEPVASVVDHQVPVDDGEITVRVYTPEGPGPFPGFVYFHGGGWVA